MCYVRRTSSGVFSQSHISALSQKVRTCVVSSKLKMKLPHFSQWKTQGSYRCRCICQQKDCKSLSHVPNLLSPSWRFWNFLWMRIWLKHLWFPLTIYSYSGSQGFQQPTPRGRKTHWTGHQSTHQSHTLARREHANSSYKYQNHLAMRQWCGFYYDRLDPSWAGAMLSSRRPHVEIQPSCKQSFATL